MMDLCFIGSGEIVRRIGVDSEAKNVGRLKSLVFYVSTFFCQGFQVWYGSKEVIT